MLARNGSASHCNSGKCYNQSPLAPVLGGEGVLCVSRLTPSPPTPLPRVQGRGEEEQAAARELDSSQEEGACFLSSPWRRGPPARSAGSGRPFALPSPAPRGTGP